MARFVLQLVQAPQGVTVRFPEGANSIECQAGRAIVVGQGDACDVQIDGREVEALVEEGFGGLLRLSGDGTSWMAEHLGSAGWLTINGRLASGQERVFGGDLLSIGRELVFALVDLDRPSALEHEPSELLDAVAADPDDWSRWHVLADWLNERHAPHALLAAYELRLRDGTNDPELLEEYAATRRRRHALGDARIDRVRWRCGYVVSCELVLGPRDPLEPDRWQRTLAGPQFRALSSVELWCQSPASAARIEGLVRALPKTVRAVGLRLETQGSASVVRALAQRPENAHTVRLRLGRSPGPLQAALELLAASGWTAIELDGTSLAGRLGELRPAIARNEGVRFMLGGTELEAVQARSLNEPNVMWSAPHHDALIVEVGTGRVVPVSPLEPSRFAWLGRLGDSWVVDGDRPLRSGEAISVAGKTYVFLDGAGLDAQYRAWLAQSAAR